MLLNILLVAEVRIVKLLFLIIVIILVVVSLVQIFVRYIPVRLTSQQPSNISKNGLSVIDLRDYQESEADPISNAMNIPCGYLNRYADHIDNKVVHLIASSHLEKNIGTRILRKKGFVVHSYTLQKRRCS